MAGLTSHAVAFQQGPQVLHCTRAWEGLVFARRCSGTRTVSRSGGRAYKPHRYITDSLTIAGGA